MRFVIALFIDAVERFGFEQKKRGNYMKMRAGNNQNDKTTFGKGQLPLLNLTFMIISWRRARPDVKPFSEVYFE